MTETGRTARALPVLFGLGGVWGASFLFIKVIVDETGPLELVAGRMFFGALAVGLFVLYRRLPVPFQPRLIAGAAVLALVGNVIPFALIAWGEEHIDSGTASVLNSTVPVFTAVFAAALLEEEHFTAARLGGLVLAMFGILVLTGDDVLHITDASVLGQMAVIAAAACYGIAAVLARTLLKSQDPVGLSIVQLCMGTLLVIPILFIISGTPDYSLSLEAALSLVALGVFGTGFGYIVYLWLIEKMGSVRASLVTYIVPVMGLLLGWLVLDESAGLNTILGALLIVAGVASVMRGQAPVRRSPPAVSPVAAE
jgi:drug/metabolite transporter (DMT)-like permease